MGIDFVFSSLLISLPAGQDVEQCGFFGFLGFLVAAIVIGIAASEAKEKWDGRKKCAQGGFRPITTRNTGRNRARKRSSDREPGAQRPNNAMRGVTTNPQVDWITGRRIGESSEVNGKAR